MPDQPPPSAPAPAALRRRVLIVDDDRFSRQLVGECLTRQGYEVVNAGDAATALVEINRHPPDLVVTDMIMPGITGFELLTEVKKLHPCLPVIIITAKPKVEAAVACIKTGAFDYLTKPLNLARFVEHVELALQAGDKAATGEHQERTAQLLSRWRSIAGYDLIKVLGEGGLGVVFLAEKRRPEEAPQQYALKILKPEVLAGSDMLGAYERFMREAELAAEVVHPNVIRIREYGLAQAEEIPYIVMDYIEGRPLSYYIVNNDELTHDQKAEVLRQIASALTAVHARNMFHRDIKPDNILVAADLHVTLTDFGIARSLENQRLTHTGFIIGSPAYMAPELFDRLLADARSDIFSLGTVAYELLVGMAPFEGDTLEDLADSIRNDTPPDPLRFEPTLSPRLVQIVMKMLDKRPEERYQSARSVMAALDEYLNPHSLLKSLLRRHTR